MIKLTKNLKLEKSKKQYWMRERARKVELKLALKTRDPRLQDQ